MHKYPARRPEAMQLRANILSVSLLLLLPCHFCHVETAFPGTRQEKLDANAALTVVYYGFNLRTKNDSRVWTCRYKTRTKVTLASRRDPETRDRNSELVKTMRPLGVVFVRPKEELAMGAEWMCGFHQSGVLSREIALVLRE